MEKWIYRESHLQKLVSGEKLDSTNFYLFFIFSFSSSTTDSKPERKMNLPSDFKVSNETIDDSKIANQASLSQTQIIIIGGAGGGCLLIILGTSMSLLINSTDHIYYLALSTVETKLSCTVVHVGTKSQIKIFMHFQLEWAPFNQQTQYI